MSTGFTFGAKTTAAPAFGTGSITFGTPAAQPTQQFGFGTPASSTPNLFGTQSAPTSTLGFGAPTSTPSTGFAFGTATPSLGAPVSSGFSFGAPASTAPSSGFSFGGAPATTSTGLSFGAPAATSFKPATTGTGLSFGAPSLSFGATTTAAPTAATGFSFGGATTSTSAPSLGLSFGAATTSAPSLGLGTGLGLGGPATSSTGLSLATTTQQNVGLGGVAFTQSKTGTSSSTQKELPPKEQLLPNEFTQLVDQFKNIVQDEKNRSSDVARSSIKEFRKVESELDSLNHQFSQFEHQLLTNRNLAEKLKYDTAKGLQNIEMAQRTQDTPPSLQFDNTAPLQYFLDLADTFEKEMQLLKMRIDNTEKYVKKCRDSDVLTSQDLAVGLKRLHETFVALAGRMQSVHSQVEVHKEHFLNIRKQILRDTTNPFERQDKSSEAMNLVMKNTIKVIPPNLASGPTPFNNMALNSNLTMSAQQAQTPAFPAVTTTALGMGLTPVNNSLFGTSSFQLNSSNNFQLQKPPTGNKRGKQ